MEIHKGAIFDRLKIIVIYTVSGIKAILQDSSVKIADDEGVSPSSSVITRVSCICFSPRVMYMYMYMSSYQILFLFIT
jgi:hypothetical protein